MFAYSLLGSPISTLNALAGSATALQQALSTGNLVGAVNVLIDAPAAALDGFLNGETIVDSSIVFPTGLPPVYNVPNPLYPPFLPKVLFSIPLPSTASLTFHLPFDGILGSAAPDSGDLRLPRLYLSARIPGHRDRWRDTLLGIDSPLVNLIPEELAALIRNPG